tara:strand:- start:141 stop:458 length:318 start_codon:yes stop_codon:yes gene_type:complete
MDTNMDTRSQDTDTVEVNIVKKTTNKEYMRNYMRDYYKKNPLKLRKYRLSCNTRKKYKIPVDILNKYQEDIHHIVKIKKLFDELNETSLVEFLKEYETLSFQECP